MISAKLSSDPLAVARVSHAVRASTSEASWFEINSTEVDRLLSTPLPSAQRQLENLIGWIKAKVGADPFDAVQLASPEILSAVIGVSNPGNVKRLIRWARKEGFLELESGGTIVRLTPLAWKSGADEQSDRPEIVKDAPAKVELGHCPACGPDRRTDVVARHEERSDDNESGVWAIDDYMVLKCRGCGTVFVKLSRYFSEDVDYEVDERSGDVHPINYPKVSYWPAPSRRKRPDWIDRLEDRILHRLLEEVYLALDADQSVLAAIGTRTALDRAMVLLGAREADNFAQKLEWLREEGLVSGKEKEILLILTDAGGAAAHRGWRPELPELTTILDGAESFLHRTLVLGAQVSAMRINVPARSPRQNK